jgi:aldehyde:ferredoxin oxidoreductase
MCIFTTRTWVSTLCRALSAATGWDYTKEDAMRYGRRTAALLRAFNVRCGITPELERPSKRYGSVPIDGPAKGQNVLANWERMLDVWYDTVGYDRKTGKPLPATLQELGLEHLIPDLWGAKETANA